MAKNNNLVIDSLIALILVLIFVYVKCESYLNYATDILTAALIYMLALASIIFLLFLFFRYITKKITSRKTAYSDFRTSLKKLSERALHGEESAKDAKTKLNLLIGSNPRFAQKSDDLVLKIRDSIIHEIEKSASELQMKNALQKKQMQKEEMQIRREAIKKQSDKKKIIQLKRYFRRKNSARVLPQWAISYEPKLVNKAAKEYESKKRENEFRQKKWKEAANFVLENKAYPLDFHNMNKEERSMYLKAMEMLKKRTLQKEIKAAANKYAYLDKSPFYYSDQLREDEKTILLSSLGYKKTSFMFRDGSSGNKLIIKKLPEETVHHFCMKHIFADIDKEHSKFDYKIENKTVDLAFIYKNGKIAVIIESGNDIQTDLLNRNFDFWIIICRKENIGIYRKLADNKKSFCLRIKQADEKLKQLTDSLR